MDIMITIQPWTNKEVALKRIQNFKKNNIKMLKEIKKYRKKGG